MKDIDRVLVKLKQWWAQLERVIEYMVNPPLVISSAVGGLEEEYIKNNLKPSGVVVLPPSTQFEYYVPKIPIDFLGRLIEVYENYLSNILMLNEGIMSGNFKNVRSYSQLALLIQSVMADIKHYALMFEQMLEKFATNLAYALIYYCKSYKEYMGADFVVEVFAHSSSPLTALQYHDFVFTLLDAGILSVEDVIDLLPIPNKSKVVMRAKIIEAQKMVNQSNEE